jgi:hypothetical protein
MAKYCYATFMLCSLCWVSFILSVIYAECYLCWMSQIITSCQVSLCGMSLCWVSWRPRPSTLAWYLSITSKCRGSIDYYCKKLYITGPRCHRNSIVRAFTGGHFITFCLWANEGQCHKTFFDVNYPLREQTRVFVKDTHFHPSLMFVDGLRRLI